MSFKALIVCFCLGLAVVNATPLDDYVNTPDSHYNYVLLKQYSMKDYTFYVLNMTSQKWLNESIVVNPIWWHFLSITVPNKITRGDAALLYIDGGNNNGNTYKIMSV